MRLGPDRNGEWATVSTLCPACNQIIVEVVCAAGFRGAGDGEFSVNVRSRTLGYPRAAARPKPPTEVPKSLAGDYNEAALVLPDSPKASAALSRRCIQHVLRECAKVQRPTLAAEIDAVLEMRILPSGVADALDAAREIGNFAAHPTKSEHTGEVVDVEPGEAEWNLDVLDGLFDVFFVQPARLVGRKAALNEKLKAAGKKPLD